MRQEACQRFSAQVHLNVPGGRPFVDFVSCELDPSFDGLEHLYLGKLWARRQAHETAVHRFDAQHATGAGSGFGPMFASDGIDKMVCGFAPRADQFPPRAPGAWSFMPRTPTTAGTSPLAASGITTTRGDGPADVTLSGDASDLYLALWNRGNDSTITVKDDPERLDLWHANKRVRWSRSSDTTPGNSRQQMEAVSWSNGEK